MTWPVWVIYTCNISYISSFVSTYRSRPRGLCCLRYLPCILCTSISAINLYFIQHVPRCGKFSSLTRSPWHRGRHVRTPSQETGLLTVRQQAVLLLFRWCFGFHPRLVVTTDSIANVDTLSNHAAVTCPATIKFIAACRNNLKLFTSLSSILCIATSTPRCTALIWSWVH